jgi:3'5'-cyclic nucleotide phosphodiesterase
LNGNKNDLKATIVIEHIIQASDVSHTMQHWHVYRKWNARLFQEMYLAFRSDRMQTDPSTFWYQGELSFFDNYIIPLAKKLKDCKIFGVSSDEYLNYAFQNRTEWEERGMEIVEQLKEECVGMYEPLTPTSTTGSTEESDTVLAEKENLSPKSTLGVLSISVSA